jgi:hypothetical protein
MSKFTKARNVLEGKHSAITLVVVDGLGSQLYYSLWFSVFLLAILVKGENL